jgi:hypothetical protein
VLSFPGWPLSKARAHVGTSFSIPTAAQIEKLSPADRKQFARIVHELYFRKRAEQLVPGIGSPPKRSKLYPYLCKYTNLQPSEAKKLSNAEITPFIELAIEEKTGKRLKSAELKVVPCVILGQRGEHVFVSGIEKRRLSDAQYDVISTLLKVNDKGLGKDQLASQSGHGDAVRVLKRLSRADEDWRNVIVLPGKTGGRYRLKGPF